MWKKITESQDLISYKKDKSDKQIVIEARMMDGRWEIYKTYQYGMNRLVQEYTADDKSDALHLIETLKKEKDLSNDEIEHIRKFESQNIKINLERAYKEYDVEKWLFSINDEPKDNFIIVRFAEEIEADVVMHERYRRLERKILEKLQQSLKLEDELLRQSVFFYKEKKDYGQDRRKVFVGRIEMGFSE